MKATKIIIPAILLAAGFLTSCYSHQWDNIHPAATSGNGGTNNTCTITDTTTVSYSVTIAPIISSKCATSPACHGYGAPGNPNDYSTYAGLYTDCRHDTSGAVIWPYITGASGDPMPQPGNPQLTTCEKKAIANWIHQGAPQN